MAKPVQPKSKPFLWVSGILFLIYLANVIVGKLSVLGGSGTIAGIGDVAEFLVLFGAAALFIVAVLIKEHAADSASTPEHSS